MSRALRILPIAAALVALSVAGGCGGGPEQVSAEELVSKGDDICRQGQQRFDEVQKDLPANASDAVDQTKELVQVSEDELNDLRDLEPPDDLQDAYDRYLEARGRALEYFRRGEDAASSQDSEGYIEAQTGVAKRAAERKKLAEAVGFAVCSNPQQAS